MSVSPAWKRAAFVLTLTVASVGWASELLACDAPPPVPRGPSERFERYDVIARGTVTRVTSVHGHDGRNWQAPDLVGGLWSELTGHSMKVVIRVDEAWKGVESTRLVVHDDGPDTCCGMRFVERGDEILVYAHDVDGKLFVDGYCAPMIPIADAGEDLAWLGPGIRDFPFYRRINPWLLGFVALALLAVGVVVRRPTRKPRAE